jgi:hypothetical protein
MENKKEKYFEGIVQIKYTALAENEEQARKMIQDLMEFHCRRGIEILPNQWDDVKLISVKEKP